MSHLQIYDGSFMEGMEGIFLNLAAEVYHGAPGVSNSMLREMTPPKTPAHLRAYLQEERPEPTAYQIMGTLIHERVLEPGREPTRIVVPPEEYAAPADSSLVKSKKLSAGDKAKWSWNANYCKQWGAIQRSKGNVVLSQLEHDKVLGCVDAVAKHPTCSKIFEQGKSEVSIFRRYDTETGSTLRKARLDFIPGGNALVDVKTCEDASDEGFQKTIHDNCLYNQAAYYLDIVNDSVPPSEQRECFVFIAVERKPPYLVALYNLSPRAIAKGREQNRELLAKYIECEITGEFPGYAESILEIDLPQYAYPRLAI